MKNVKWLQKVELVDHNYKGYWEEKGWSDTAEILTLSQILMPMTGQKMQAGTHVVGGIAYAGRRGVAKVELSLDGEKTWNLVELKSPLSDFAWVIWRYEWKANQKGNFRLRVRATDKKGNIQESGSLLARSYPDGAKGIHEIKISIT
jgi:DMSO/TMAO reductase YedYZ molybdopterin-dependent catalytic subunit